jgi:hypothetical protein
MPYDGCTMSYKTYTMMSIRKLQIYLYFLVTSKMAPVVPVQVIPQCQQQLGIGLVRISLVYSLKSLQNFKCTVFLVNYNRASCL